MTIGGGVLAAIELLTKANYPRRFRLAPDSQTVSLGIEGAGPRPLTVRFFAQSVRPFRGP